MCPPASPPSAGKGSLVQRELSPGGRLRDCPRLLNTFGMLSAACPTHPLRPLAQTLRPAPLARAVEGASLSSRRGRCPHRPVAWHPGRPVGAGLCPRPLLPGLMGSLGAPSGPTCVSGPVHGRTHRSAPTRLPEAFRNQWESGYKPRSNGRVQKAPPLPCAACFCTSKDRRSPIFCAAKQGE